MRILPISNVTELLYDTVEAEDNTVVIPKEFNDLTDAHTRTKVVNTLSDKYQILTTELMIDGAETNILLAHEPIWRIDKQSRLYQQLLQVANTGDEIVKEMMISVVTNDGLYFVTTPEMTTVNKLVLHALATQADIDEDDDLS